MSSRLTPDLILRAYSCGVFPMAETADDPEVFWVDPDERGILPLDTFHLSHSLRKTLRNDTFRVTCDHDFSGVIEGCAEPKSGREGTWINGQIVDVFSHMHRLGFAHSIECWRGDALVGGLYGLSLGGAFFGESMFSRATDASKVALCHLVARLRYGNFSLLDIQFVTEHLSQFGAVEIAREEYLMLLDEALKGEALWPHCSFSGADVAALLSSQPNTQTS